MDVEHRTLRADDGTPIAYQVMGTGVRPLILANGIATDYTAWRYFTEHFGHQFRIYAWDYRGQHRSGRPIGGLDQLRVADHASDLRALIDHEGLGRPIGVGWSMGVQIMLEATRDAPGLFGGMVLHNGVAGRLYSTAFMTSYAAAVLPVMVGAFAKFDGVSSRFLKRVSRRPALLALASRAGLIHHAADLDVIGAVFRHLSETDTKLFLQALQALHEHDAYDVLADIACPTLVVASSADIMTPMETLQQMAEAIPDAELHVVPGGTHWAMLEMPAAVNRRLEAFFVSRRLA